MAIMTIPNDELAELRKLDPDFDRFLSGEDAIEKDLAVGDVHAAGADEKKPTLRLKPKPTTFLENIADDVAKAAPEFDALIKEISAPSALALAAANNVSIDKAADRALKPHPKGGAHSPFPFDPQAMDKIPPDQTRRFLGALTSSDDLEQRSIPMKSLVSIQDRVSPTKIESMQRNGFDKLPTVVRYDGKNYIVDGTHRASAQWLDGDNHLDCKFCALRGADDSLAKADDFGFHIVAKGADFIDWVFNFEFQKADEDQQLIFGWASVAQEGDYLVLDHQDDMMLPETLEKGAYDFVLEARQHGDSHKTIGTGRLVESMVFTKEKQDLLGVVIKNKAGNQIVGWWTGFKVDSPELWALHKAGERPDFSIGGRSSSIDVSELFKSGER